MIAFVRHGETPPNRAGLLLGRSDVALTVVSGETRLYANLLLRIGVVWPAGHDERTEAP